MRAVVMVAVAVLVTALAGCAKHEDLVATGGSRSDGIAASSCG